MHTLFIGIDNGTTGTIGVIMPNMLPLLYHTPTVSALNYQKKGAMIERIDVPVLVELFKMINHAALEVVPSGEALKILVLLERPFTMGYLVPAVANGLRAFEATIIAVETMHFPYEFVDSKQWQKPLLGKDIKVSAVLKKASLAKGKQMWPLLDWTGLHDADGLLIAEWARTRTPF